MAEWLTKWSPILAAPIIENAMINVNKLPRPKLLWDKCI